MESPLVRNYWNATGPRFSTIPVRQPQQEQRKPSHQPKIVSIPVRFVESERTRSEAATKIQKLFRGLLVRKNVKKIATIRSEIEEIEQRISQKETTDLIARDAKERLRLNETLMSLLFSLDSVSGVDTAVRDCRKAATRRVIVLQEAVDAIVEKQETATSTDIPNSSGNPKTVLDSDDRTLESEVPVKPPAVRASEVQDSVESSAAAEKQTSETQNRARSSDDCGNSSVDADDQALGTEYPTECTDDCRNPSGDVPIDDYADTPVAVDDQAQEMAQDPPVSTAAVEGCGNTSVAVDDPAIEIESADESKEEESQVEEERYEAAKTGGSERKCEMMAMEDNEKLRSMVAELQEKNEEQSRLIGALWRRVDQLERTVEMMRRKKKRHQAAREAESRRKCERRL